MATRNRVVKYELANKNRTYLVRLVGLRLRLFVAPRFSDCLTQRLAGFLTPIEGIKTIFVIDKENLGGSLDGNNSQVFHVDSADYRCVCHFDLLSSEL